MDETPGNDRDQTIQDISNWMLEQILGKIDLQALLEGIGGQLAAAGLPVVRGYMGTNVLHPMFVARTFLWQKDGGGEEEAIPHHNGLADDWLNSPVKVLIDEGIDEVRYNLETDGDWRHFPILARLQGQGITEYVGLRTAFDSLIQGEVDGTIIAWSTDRPGGFSDADMETLRRLQLRMAAAVKTHKGEQTARNILTAYLGGDAAQRVLAGQIQRGAGDVIPCVIWYSDMRNSTMLADELDGPEFLAALNDYFESTAGAVLASGGDVLRFIGDAVLAVYPIADNRYQPADACRAALETVRVAEANLDAVNARRRKEGKCELSFGLGLHLGEVLFGNIGTPERVEFSVIGPSANEVARIEGMTKDLECPVLVSDTFARELDIDWLDCGAHRLRGVGSTMKLFAPPTH